MRLGAFVQYDEYTVSRHQQVGRSTCRVHPCKQEKTGSASAGAVANPPPASPLDPRCPQPPLFYQDNSGIGNLQDPPVAGGTHTHNENRKNKNRARKAVKEYSSGTAGLSYRRLSVCQETRQCAALHRVISGPAPSPALTIVQRS